MAMSFEIIKNNINTFSLKSSISIEDMLEMFESIYFDICEINKSEDAETFDVQDIKKMLLRFGSLMETLIPVYKANKSGMIELSSSLQGQLNKVEADCLEANNQLSQLNKEIDAVSLKKDKLQYLYDECTSKSSELVRINEHCKQMQTEIDSMSDLDLEKLKREEASLTTELKERRSQKEMLDDEIRNVRQAIENIDVEISRLTATDSELAEELDDKTKNKTSLEHNIESMQTQIAEIKDWIEKFPEYSKKIEEEFGELDAEVKAIVNVWNSAHTDTFLAKALSENPNGQFFNENNDIKELKDIDMWFERLLSYLEDLSQEANEKIKCLNDNISKITADIPKITEDRGVAL